MDSVDVKHHVYLLHYYVTSQQPRLCLQKATSVTTKVAAVLPQHSQQGSLSWFCGRISGRWNVSCHKVCEQKRVRSRTRPAEQVRSPHGVCDKGTNSLKTQAVSLSPLYADFIVGQLSSTRSRLLQKMRSPLAKFFG